MYIISIVISASVYVSWYHFLVLQNSLFVKFTEVNFY
jgi:hypothetical protein